MLLSRSVTQYELLLEKSVVLKQLLPYHHAIVGGAIRSWFLEETPRDIDIAVALPANRVADEVNRLGNKVIAAKNRFGGWKLVERSTDGPPVAEFDIWSLEETEGLKTAYKERCYGDNSPCHSYCDPWQFFTFENLAKYSPWSTDAVNLEIKHVETPEGSTRTIKFNDRGFVKSVLTNAIDMNYDCPTTNHSMKALRGLRTAKKGLIRSSLKMTDTAREYIGNHLNLFGKSPEEVIALLKVPTAAMAPGGSKTLHDYGPLKLVYKDRKVVEIDAPLLNWHMDPEWYLDG